MNIFSELYIKHLARTLFFLSIGISSAMGQNILTKNILHDDFFASVVAVVWAALLIAIYSYFIADRENRYNLLTESFNYHRTLRPDNRIGAVVRSYEDVPTPRAPAAPPAPVPEKSDITKVEFIHSMAPMDPAEKNPAKDSKGQKQ